MTVKTGEIQIMAKSKTKDSDAEPMGQRGSNIEKMGGQPYRETPPAPVPGSKDDRQKKSQPEKLHGPLSGEEQRSGTNPDQ